MEDLSLHILDLAENAIRAKAKKIVIEVFENKDDLTIVVADNGRGMDQQTLKKALDPFFTTKNGKKFGLGLALFSQAAQQTEGRIKVWSRVGEGTRIRAVFNRHHPDMKPLGAILETLACLIAANPDIRFVYNYKKGKKIIGFDSFGKK